MKLLVTGGCGFIGSNFIHKQLDETENTILNIDKLTYAGNPENLNSQLANQNYEFIQGDICDAELIGAAIRKFRPHVVFHFAAESHVDRSIDGPADFINTNIIGTYTLLAESLKYYNGLSDSDKLRFRFLHVSTDEVFGSLGETGYFTETTAYDPRSPYSASKASSDHLVNAWYHTFGLPILITNCSNNYGPFQFPEKLIPLMILNCLAGKPLPVYGTGSNIRDWLHVEDHCNALYRVSQKGKPGETYNIGGNTEKTNLEVVHTICDVLDTLKKVEPNQSFRKLITFVEDRPGHDQRYAIDASKIKAELGWTPEHTFETGMENTIKWYLNQTDWWKRIQDNTYQQQRLGKVNE